MDARPIGTATASRVWAVVGREGVREQRPLPAAGRVCRTQETSTDDGQGNESEAPLNERIGVGLFTAEPGRDAFDASDVVLREPQHGRLGSQTFSFVTDQRPTFVGVDPYNTFIDRNPADNVRPVN